MDWTSAVVSIGGLFVAALSLWLSYKDRTSVHREILYKKQIEAYTALINTLHPWHERWTWFSISLLTNRSREDHEWYSKELDELRKLGREFYTEYQKWALFLPATFHDEISKFYKVIGNISKLETNDVVSQDVIKLIDIDYYQTEELSSAYGRIIAAARRGLGIEPLSKEILKLIGDGERDGNG
jgi:hypothetical protein